jgi:phage protein D
MPFVVTATQSFVVLYFPADCDFSISIVQLPPELPAAPADKKAKGAKSSAPAASSSGSKSAAAAAAKKEAEQLKQQQMVSTSCELATSNTDAFQTLLVKTCLLCSSQSCLFHIHARRPCCCAL